MSTTTYRRGDVVLVEFPFTDGRGVKQRPALIISSSLYHAGRREAVIAAITSNTRRVLPGDQPLADWRQGGLLLPSLVTGIFGTVQTSAIRRRLGALTPNDMGSVNAAMRLALGL